MQGLEKSDGATTVSRPVVEDNDILVRAQDTPNPYAYKFVVNQPLKSEGKATFSTREEAAGKPLVEAMFDLPGVKQVYLFQNTVTITHDGSMEGQNLKDDICSIIKTRLPIHSADFMGPDEEPEEAKAVDRSHLSKELIAIEEILDRTVRPGLQADGGDVEIISFENNELRILYQGACGGCPSAMFGTLDAIQSILAHELDKPEIRVTPI